MQPPTFSVVLRIRHPSLDPEEITRELGIVPEHSWKAGDKRLEDTGSSSLERYAQTYWLAPIGFPADSDIDVSESLEGTITVAAVQLKSRRSLWQRIRHGGGSADFLVYIACAEPADINLTSETMSLLEGIGLSISFETRPGRAAVA